ncbi:hypothetical protein N7462_011523 [Penicillium macrosclerotiorum]|uniref:uncharacterized protein n=1 Tax=Penicillium macrosclerotiorum TaxID=303699 RepID=UPI0025491B8E|nr:uncharacterized protein N7462_011523 [Penicillium macrosclerotiorum]KAJ5664710.1 hypothetical protein N7462_011523 [Penicillium macrosclerotiorum]
MILPRRAVLFLGLSFFLILFYTAHQLSQPWRNYSQAVGLGEHVFSSTNWTGSFNFTTSHGGKSAYAPQPNFVPGTAKPLGYNYTKTLVVARIKSEDTTWIGEELPDWGSAVYVADDPKAPLHPPQNKGHEVMVYISYIIDFYENLPDVAVFMHSHQEAWHNEDLFDRDAAEILRHLSLDRVTRQGYMNIRCQFGPGCPAWMHPGALIEDETKQEEVMLARAWGELFPDQPVPSVLAQPCCAQFAVSRDRIRTIPRARFIFYRDWLLQTDLSDYIAGRIWEYLWQFVFTGQPVVCVEESVCLCDGYGVCFGGPDEFQAYRNLETEKNELQTQLDSWISWDDEFDFDDVQDDLDETTELDVPHLSRKAKFERLVFEKQVAVADTLEAAFERGKHPRNRALEAGRPWKEGDGF